MKITDLFTRIQKGSVDSGGGKTSRLIQPVQPVGIAGKLTLVPGQLLQGEVMGHDSNGLLLLKLAGEIISARTPMTLEPGQQFWFEVKEAGESPLLNLASGKGAIQDLLKEIMATRPLMVKAEQPQAASPQDTRAAAGQQPTSSTPSPAAASLQTQVGSTAQAQSTGEAPIPQASPSQVEQIRSQPLPVVGRDGALPPEGMRLVRALVSWVDAGKSEISPTGASAGSQKLPPLIKTIATLIRDEQIPPSLLKLESFAQVVKTVGRAGVESGQLQHNPLPGGPESAGKEAPLFSGQDGARPSYVPPGTTPSAGVALAPSTIKILNALVAISGIKPPTGERLSPLQPAASPDQNLAEILTVIGREGRIPENIQQLAPVKILINPGAVTKDTMFAAVEQSTVGSDPGLVAETGALSKAAFPLQYAAAQQGAEPMPAQLRLLASLMGLGPKESNPAAWREIEEILVRIPEAEMPMATRKFASFFEAHSRVNEELAGQSSGSQSDFYIMPTVFAGQTGWGEWLWSKEDQPGNNDGKSQENLVFFLEMSNLGALTIQILLKEKKLRGQIIMSDKKGSELVASLLPGLQPRLEALGYEMDDFSCTCQPVNLMQELKESLHGQIGSGTVSLLDVQV